MNSHFRLFPVSSYRAVAVALLMVCAVVFTLVGCVDNSSPSTSASPQVSEFNVTQDPALVALLPKDIVSSGELKIGVDPSYSPNEFKNDQGELDGWNVDLSKAIAAKLGLEANFGVSKFDNVLPSVAGGKQNVGISSFTYTPERQKQVDFVNYYVAGSLWAAPVGSDILPDQACGLKVAVQTGTTQDTDELPARSAACQAAGKPAISAVRFDGQDQVTNAVVIGQADAMSADSPVSLYAVSKSNKKIETIGELFDAAPYGVIVQQGSELTGLIRQTIQSLIDDGTYFDILKKWGVEAGAVEEATINTEPVRK